MTTKQMQFEVSQNILTKIPRYFGGKRSILRELFQNSFRANAENVTIHYDEHTLLFEDDGCGSDAQSLLTAGQSGWEQESPAVDPAGLGAFSFLRPEYVEKVTYRSRDWQMTLTPANLETRDVEVEYDLESAPGMRVELTLTAKVQFDEDDFLRARGLYPMNVSYCGTDKELKELKPKKLVDYEPILDVPGVGRVGFGAFGSEHWSGIESRVVWQYAYSKSLALENALQEAVKALTNPQENSLAYALFHWHAITLFVDPASGIRPKLPDREEVIDDNHLSDAARKIVRAALDEYLTGFDLEKIKALPDLIDEERDSKEGPSASQQLRACMKEGSLAEALTHGNEVLREVWSFFGYICVVQDDPSEIMVVTMNEGDGNYPQTESGWRRSTRFARQPVICINDDGLRSSLLEQGFQAVNPWSLPKSNPAYGQQTKLEIEVSGLRYKTEEGDWLAFADTLKVNGKPVQFLARTEGGNWYCPELDAIDQEREQKKGDNSNRSDQLYS